MHATGSLIVCLREYLMLQFSGEKEKKKKEEMMGLAMICAVCFS